MPSLQGDVLLQASGVVVRDAVHVVRLHGLDLSLRAGEIVGVAGVSRATARANCWTCCPACCSRRPGNCNWVARPLRRGTLADPLTARALGLAHVPEDRHARALVMDFVAWESAVLGYDKLPEYARWGWMDHGGMRQATGRMMERFDVRPRNPELRCSKFSGRQPAKAGVGAGTGPGTQSVAGGPAHARRGHWRH